MLFPRGTGTAFVDQASRLELLRSAEPETRDVAMPNAKPEEVVRQLWIFRLMHHYQYPLPRITVYYPITFRRDTLKRADIVVLDVRSSPKYVQTSHWHNRKNDMSFFLRGTSNGNVSVYLLQTKALAFPGVLSGNGSLVAEGDHRVDLSGASGR